ncbi:MAG: hypothetical protein E4H01_11595 [Lysobacterales bacterium]|nr:MAG: hypothetical protein E4H01_11595 [Xanthomonadales bacterium]
MSSQNPGLTWPRADDARAAVPMWFSMTPLGYPPAVFQEGVVFTWYFPGMSVVPQPRPSYFTLARESLGVPAKVRFFGWDEGAYKHWLTFDLDMDYVDLGDRQVFTLTNPVDEQGVLGGLTYQFGRITSSSGFANVKWSPGANWVPAAPFSPPIGFQGSTVPQPWYWEPPTPV